MPAEHYHQLPTFMQELSSQCKDHKMKFELYCSFHACPCCVQCVSDKYQKCQDLKAFSDVLRQVKASASIQLLEKDLKDVKENLDTTMKYMKTRISTINTQKKIAVEEIRYMRKSINDYLKKLEQDIFIDLESKHLIKLILDMATILQQMEQRASQINQMQSQFTKMTQYSTELQMFIGLREVEKTTSQTAKYIEYLESGDHFIEKNLQVSISSALQSILRDVKLFGDINIDTTSSNLQIKAGREDQAQNLILKVPGIKQIKPSLLTRLEISKDMMYLRIYACRILPDGKFIILDGSKHQLLLFGKDGTFIRIVVTFSESPFDACFVRSNTVAVTLGLVHQTPLVDIEKNKSKIIQTIKLSHFCYGVASDGKNLVISSNNRHITTVNLDDMSHTIIEGMEGVGCISLFQGNIYGTNYSGDKVCCYKSTGEPLWTFQHQDIGRPEGITIDMHGFVYIASYGTNNVVLVSPDGQTSKTIISEADGIIRPYGIDVNKETKIIIVSSKTRENSKTDYETAFVYTI